MCIRDRFRRAHCQQVGLPSSHFIRRLLHSVQPLREYFLLTVLPSAPELLVACPATVGARMPEFEPPGTSGVSPEELPAPSPIPKALGLSFLVLESGVMLLWPGGASSSKLPPNPTSAVAGDW